MDHKMKNPCLYSGGIKYESNDAKHMVMLLLSRVEAQNLERHAALVTATPKNIIKLSGEGDIYYVQTPTVEDDKLLAVNFGIKGTFPTDGLQYGINVSVKFFKGKLMHKSELIVTIPQDVGKVQKMVMIYHCKNGDTNVPIPSKFDKEIIIKWRYFERKGTEDIVEFGETHKVKILRGVAPEVIEDSDGTKNAAGIDASKKSEEEHSSSHEEEKEEEDEVVEVGRKRAGGSLSHKGRAGTQSTRGSKQTKEGKKEDKSASVKFNNNTEFFVTNSKLLVLAGRVKHNLEQINEAAFDFVPEKGTQSKDVQYPSDELITQISEGVDLCIDQMAYMQNHLDEMKKYVVIWKNASKPPGKDKK